MATRTQARRSSQRSTSQTQLAEASDAMWTDAAKTAAAGATDIEDAAQVMAVAEVLDSAGQIALGAGIHDLTRAAVATRVVRQREVVGRLIGIDVRRGHLATVPSRAGALVVAAVARIAEEALAARSFDAGPDEVLRRRDRLVRAHPHALGVVEGLSLDGQPLSRSPLVSELQRAYCTAVRDELGRQFCR